MTKRKPNRFGRATASLRASGLVQEAADILAGRHISVRMKRNFTAMTPARQIAVAKTIAESGDPIVVHLVPMLLRSRPSDLAVDTLQDWGVQLRDEWRRQSGDDGDALALAFEEAEARIGPLRLELVVLRAFAKRLLRNPRIAGCLADDHPKALRTIRVIGGVPKPKRRRRKRPSGRWWVPGRS